MKLTTKRFLFISPSVLRFLCAPVGNEGECLITLCSSSRIAAPVLASDGRVYDAAALHHWLTSSNAIGRLHVVPGCPIDHVHITLWPEAATRIVHRIMRDAFLPRVKYALQSTIVLLHRKLRCAITFLLRTILSRCRPRKHDSRSKQTMHSSRSTCPVDDITLRAQGGAVTGVHASTRAWARILLGTEPSAPQNVEETAHATADAVASATTEVHTRADDATAGTRTGATAGTRAGATATAEVRAQEGHGAGMQACQHTPRVSAFSSIPRCVPGGVLRAESDFTVEQVGLLLDALSLADKDERRRWEAPEGETCQPTYLCRYRQQWTTF
jgi:hypothetical protein